ncbi:mitochondrial 37S ribosomal protein RSM18 [Teratosphaeria destructans]|uniref:Small ribosomal subunit protein bS18m n=1 Tax=Teratosphaeria destructans TaxID=418781 RepID=A0A9W7SHP1_9PEZI|nr:mitochondrial 37S ribosomal protein RSM18 [Teratosphaeria destructans]
MPLEQSFRRLALQPSAACRQYRRAFATAVPRQEQQQQGGATDALSDLMQASRIEEAQSRHQQRRTPNPVSAAAPPSPGSPAASSTRNTTAFDLAANFVRESSAGRQARDSASQLRDIERTYNRKDLEGQLPRRWKSGDVYAPHDLSGVEMSKWKKLSRKPRTSSKGRDVLDQLGINPLKEYKNFSIMSEYVTEMGRIRHSTETGLRPVNQRKMAKAIRRAIGMGLIPSVYQHPELIREELSRRHLR